jgi:glycolate oxidase iron-sulfur subunit
MSSYLEKHRDEASKCVKCGICHTECPTYIATGDEAMVARGRLTLLEAVIEGDLKLSEEVEDRVSKCTSCLSCVTNCPRGIDPVKIINAAKGEYFKNNNSDYISKLVFKYFRNNGKSLFPFFKLLGMATNMFYNRIPAEGWITELLPFVRNGIKKSIPQFGKRSIKDELPEIIKVKNPKMRVVFFTGCMTDFVYQEAGRKIISILKSNQIETIIPKNIGCCGAPAYYMGDHKTATQLASNNYNVLSKLNPDFILVNCATCGEALTSVYEILLNVNPVRDISTDSDVKPSLQTSSILPSALAEDFSNGVNSDFSRFSNKVIDIHKFLIMTKSKIVDLPKMPTSKRREVGAFDKVKGNSEIIEQLQEIIRLNKRVRVTYHDPCHLNRGQKVHSEPREIIKSLPWVEFVEMDSADACCGGAGGFSLKHYDLSLEIGKRKAESIKQTGADVVVTGCPSCRMQITDILNRADYKRPVLHTVELLNLDMRQVAATR